jgi:hypothetical protein
MSFISMAASSLGPFIQTPLCSELLSPRLPHHTCHARDRGTSINQRFRTLSHHCIDISHLVSVFLIRRRAADPPKPNKVYACHIPAVQFIQLAQLLPHAPPILPLIHVSHVSEDMSQSMQFPASSSAFRAVAGRWRRRRSTLLRNRIGMPGLESYVVDCVLNLGQHRVGLMMDSADGTLPTTCVPPDKS